MLQVPYRQISLTNGNKFDLYDTSGPQGVNPRDGLPKLRKSWVERREARGDKVVTQVRPSLSLSAARLHEVGEPGQGEGGRVPKQATWWDNWWL